MNYSGAITVRASVSDSRGRWSDTRDVSVTVLEYFAPALSFSIARTGSTSSTLTVTRNAKVAPLAVSGSQKNSMTLSFKVARLGTNTYTPDTGAAAGSWTSISSLVNSQANLAGNYLANQSWVVIGTLEDKFTRTEFAVNVATESVVFSYDRNGVGVNKIRERGALDVKGDIYANDKPVQQFQLSQHDGRALNVGGDWNDHLNTGFYMGYNLKNAPSGGHSWKFVQVFKHLDTWVAQVAYDFQGDFVAFRAKKSGSWQPWKKLATDDHPNLINTGWQSANFPGTYYKRVGDVLTVKYDFTGNGSTMNIGDIPSSVWVAPQEYMLVIAKWSIGGSDNSHVQINQGTSSLNVLSTGNGTTYKGQLTIMI